MTMKTAQVDVEAVYSFKQRSVKTGEWKIRKFTLGEMYEAHCAEAEEAGREPLSFSDWMADMAQYGCRREMHLTKDQDRYDAGQKPHTVYTARTHVEDARKNADQVREEAKQRLAIALKLAPARRAPKATDDGSKGGAARGVPEQKTQRDGSKPWWMVKAGL